MNLAGRIRRLHESLSPAAGGPAYRALVWIGYMTDREGIEWDVDVQRGRGEGPSHSVYLDRSAELDEVLCEMSPMFMVEDIDDTRGERGGFVRLADPETDRIVEAIEAAADDRQRALLAGARDWYVMHNCGDHDAHKGERDALEAAWTAAGRPSADGTWSRFIADTERSFMAREGREPRSLEFIEEGRRRLGLAPLSMLA